MKRGLITDEADRILKAAKIVEAVNLGDSDKVYCTESEQDKVTKKDIEENGNSKNLNEKLSNLVMLNFYDGSSQVGIEIAKGGNGTYENLFERMKRQAKHGIDRALKSYPTDIIAKFMKKLNAEFITMSKDEWKLLKSATKVDESGVVFAGNERVFKSWHRVDLPYWGEYYE